MNKQDIAIVVLLVALLFGWIHYQNKGNAERAKAWREQQAAIAATNAVPRAALSTEAQESAAFGAVAASTNAPVASAGESATPAVAEAAAIEDDETEIPEKTVKLADGEVELVVSSKGGTIRSATLLGYRTTVTKDSPDLSFDYAAAPVLALGGLKGTGANADFEIASSTATSAVLRCAAPSGLVLEREIALLPNYQIAARDVLRNPSGAAIALPATSVTMGSVIRVEKSSNNLISVDNLPAALDRRGRLGKVEHWDGRKGRSSLTGLFTGGRGGGGCAGAPDAAQFAPVAEKSFGAPQKWVALKSRFFALVFASDTSDAGYEISAARSLEKGPLAIDSVSGKMLFAPVEIAAGQSVERRHTIYIGPKKHSVLRKFGEQTGEIMEFGMWKFICVLILPLLNFFNAVFRNYGVAIIVLTILVRLIFWPLTRKSNESMKKMGAIQPQIKEIQAKFKDDPQKLQQETMKLYRDNHVNPMSSCLPMLIQIPVFIALFVVLRSATELRFASFLWISDLSEPENLLKGVIPGVPAINILPFLMAGTMFLQSKLTPSMGDPQQQKMMMWMMPLMMFFMFYSMPSALLLYWSVSQLLAIVQLVRQRKAQKTASATVGADGVIEGEAMTRQQRRRQERENG